jgi:hypothetical protein
MDVNEESACMSSTISLESSIEHAFLNILLLSDNGEVIATIENYEVKNVAPETDVKIGNILNETDIIIC